MRLFYDHQVTSLQDAGGASRYHYQLLLHLRELPGFSAVACLGAQNSVLPYRHLSGPGVRVYGWGTALSPGYPRYAANEAVSMLVSPLLGRFEVYHAGYYRALPWVRRRRLVVTHHDCVQERFPHLFRNAPAIIAAKRRLFARADRILCVSAASRADLLEFYRVPEDRTEVIHHGFAPFAAPASDDSPATDEPYILYVGSRAPYKNFDSLLAAFAESGVARSFRLQVSGGGPPSPEELARTAELGLEHQVRFSGVVDEASLAGLYRGASLFVYPSLYEGFGFPPLEAMSVGCPVLVSNRSSLPEICGDAAFRFDPGRPGELAGCLRELLADDFLRNSRRSAGFEWIGRYRWENAAQQTVEAYRRALS
jgi:glycosyltransferase involved in cell wall biosynthesis